MKKLVLLCAVLWCSAPVFAGSFPDVAEDHENYSAIEYLKNKGVVGGYGDGTFGADDKVTRAQAAKMILKSGNRTFNGLYEKGFLDVNKDDWFWEYVMVARALNIVEGYDDGNFRPNAAINLAENLKILLVANEVELQEVQEAVYADVGKDDWYNASAYYARANNLLEPDKMGKIYPGKEMTRGEFSELVYRFMVVQEQGKPFDLSLAWDYFESDYMPMRLKIADSWEVSDERDRLLIYQKDEKFKQYDPEKIFPNSGLIEVRMDPNESGLSKNQYFNNLKNAFVGSSFQEFKIGSFDALEVLDAEGRTVDFYVYLGDRGVLLVYSEYGGGTLGFYLQRVIAASLASLEYRDVVAPVEAVAIENGSNEAGESEISVSKMLEYVLVEGQGKGVLALIGDELLIETDTIGVGTGPVDYFYSASLNYTLKYERSSDVILDTRTGKTTAF